MGAVSIRHGTVEGAKHCKPRCTRCETALSEGKDGPPTNPIPALSTGPIAASMAPIPDIITFMHSGRFTEISIAQVRDQWEAVIKAFGDKFIGYGTNPEYALFAAVKRYWTSDPGTGSITVTVDMATRETSQDRAYVDEGTIGIDEIWTAAESNDSMNGYGNGE